MAVGSVSVGVTLAATAAVVVGITTTGLSMNMKGKTTGICIVTTPCWC